MGDLVRKLAKTDPTLRQAFADYSAKGENVPNHIILPYIRDAYKQLPRETIHVIDGFPRLDTQIPAFEELMDECRRNVAMVYLDLGEQSTDIAYERMKQRAIDAIKNDKEPRVDDLTPESRRKRLVIADKDIPPLVDHYEQNGSLIRIDARASIHDVRDQVRERLFVSLDDQAVFAEKRLS